MNSSNSGGATRSAIRLFDAHCHLQDRRILAVAPHLIQSSLESGILQFAVNGVTEKDWNTVKKMGEDYHCVIPNFGIHPWYVKERSEGWLSLLKDYFASTPAAAVGEIGLDKGVQGKKIEFTEQVEVFREQLKLAKDLERPVSIHCVRAYGDLMEILQEIGPFPSGVILHSYMGSAELVSGFAKLGAYFSFSGYLTSMKPTKSKKMLKAVATDRILLESDAPDGLPKVNTESLLTVPLDNSSSQDEQKEELNHPANIRTVLNYVATMLEMPEEEVAEMSYHNAIRVFTFPGSKLSGLA